MAFKTILYFGLTLLGIAIGLELLEECPKGQLLCGDRRKCVSPAGLCNYVQDCDDLSDETNLKLCQKLKKNQQPKCDDGMIACEKIEIVSSNNNNNDYDDGYYYYDRYGNRRTTTTEAPKTPRYPFLTNQCMDIITACILGKDCLGEEHATICQEIEGQKLSSLGSKIFTSSTDMEDMYALLKDISTNMKNLLNSVCPYFYTPAEEKCIWALPIKTTWFEAKNICEATGGVLAVLDDIESFEHIRNFINQDGSDFWVGGRYVTTSFRSSGTWKWVDGTKVKKDAIFWAKELSVEDSNIEERKFTIKSRPSKQDLGRNCLALLFENGYLFSDEGCSLRYSPLCVAREKANVEESVNEYRQIVNVTTIAPTSEFV